VVVVVVVGGSVVVAMVVVVGSVVGGAVVGGAVRAPAPLHAAATQPKAAHSTITDDRRKTDLPHEERFERIRAALSGLVMARHLRRNRPAAARLPMIGAIGFRRT
jgi:hypothetical protein